jgi:hypothetical protein
MCDANYPCNSAACDTDCPCECSLADVLPELATQLAIYTLSVFVVMLTLFYFYNCLDSATPRRWQQRLWHALSPTRWPLCMHGVLALIAPPDELYQLDPLPPPLLSESDSDNDSDTEQDPAWNPPAPVPLARAVDDPTDVPARIGGIPMSQHMPYEERFSPLDHVYTNQLNATSDFRAENGGRELYTHGVRATMHVDANRGGFSAQKNAFLRCCGCYLVSGLGRDQVRSIWAIPPAVTNIVMLAIVSKFPQVPSPRSAQALRRRFSLAVPPHTTKGRIRRTLAREARNAAERRILLRSLRGVTLLPLPPAPYNQYPPLPLKLCSSENHCSSICKSHPSPLQDAT